MPDGSRPPRRPPPGPQTVVLSQEHGSAIGRAQRTMVDLVYARAAVAWLQHVAPHKLPGVAADPEGLAAHLILFACRPVYWERLCALFEERGLSDRWERR